MELEQLTLFPEDILASLLVLPASKREQTMKGTCGESSSDSYKKLDLLGYLAKMYTDTSTMDSMLSLATWNQKVMKSGRLFYKLQMSERPTNVNGSLWLLSTPTASQAYKKIRLLTPTEFRGTHGKVLPGSIGEKFPSYIGKCPNPAFVEWMMGFPINHTEVEVMEWTEIL